MLCFEFADFIDECYYLLVKLVCAQLQFEDVLMLAARYHSLLKVSAILDNDVFDSLFLQFSCLLEFFDEDFIACEVSNGSFKSLFASGYLNHVVDQASAFDWLDLVADSIRKLAVRYVRKHKNIKTDWLFF